MSKEVKRYAERDAYELDKAGNYYCRHVSAMTGEGLHSKSDIAAELGWRDMQIDALLAERDALSRWKQTAEYWYGQYRLAKYVETPADHPVEGALDAWHNAYHGAQP